MSEDFDYEARVAEIVARFRAAGADAMAAAKGLDDPVWRTRLAQELFGVCQAVGTKSTRLRRRSMAEAVAARGNDAVAKELRLTPGRVSQLANDPAKHRVFFGSDTVRVAYPLRHLSTDRERPMIAAEDAATANTLATLLEGLDLEVDRVAIEPGHRELPDADTIVVCGPKSAPVAARLLERDPALAMIEDGGRWWIEETGSSTRRGSPADQPEPRQADIAYLARQIINGHAIVHIAGIHSIGSLGAAHYLAANLPALFSTTGATPFSAIIGCTHDGTNITTSELVAGPFAW
ncbi:hypothetical protein ACXIZN_41585 [Amycolatopsis sp. TRM77291]